MHVIHIPFLQGNGCRLSVGYHRETRLLKEKTFGLQWLNGFVLVLVLLQEFRAHKGLYVYPYDYYLCPPSPKGYTLDKNNNSKEK